MIQKKQSIGLTRRFIIAIAALFFLAANASYVVADVAEGLQKRKIAVLEEFSGNLVMKSLGLWGVRPKKGMDLFHGDKIISREGGTALVKFIDGAELEIRPNSTVRIAENILMEGAKKQDEKRREMRLFIGKIKYKSSDRPAMKSVLIAPAAVAALRGSEAWFGTDGKHAYLDQIEGGNEIRGNISEGFVPEISAGQAVSDKNYSAGLKSDQAWWTYLRALQSAGGLRSDLGGGSMLLAESGLIAADGSPSGGGVGNAQFMELIGLLSAYALANDEETENENTSLLNHPDKLVADRAVRALNESKLALVKAQEAMNLCIMLKKKAEKRLAGRDRYDANKRRSLRSILRIKQKASETNELSAFVKMLSAEEYTIGLYETGLKIEKLWPEIEKSAQQAIKNYEKATIIADKILNSPKWGEAEDARLKALEIYSRAASANAATAGAVVKTADAVMRGDENEAKRFENLIDETAKTRDEINTLVDQTDDIMYQVDEAEKKPEAVVPDIKKLEDIHNDVERKVNRIPEEVFVPTAPEIEEPDDEEDRRETPPEEEDIPRIGRPEEKPEKVVVDRDGDGYPAGKRDCDDSNPMVNPGMEEICGDGVDNNCNGLIDEPPCEQIFVDRDGDGYPAGPRDCNDLDPTVHVGAPEICGDGIDNNCNGMIDESPCVYGQ